MNLRQCAFSVPGMVYQLKNLPKHAKPVPGYEGVFADEKGRIFSEQSGSLKTLKIYPDRSRGTSLVYVTRDDKKRGAIAELQKLVAAAFLGPRPPHLRIVFLNGDRTDCRPANLAYRCPAEAIARTSTNVRLSETQVRAILASTEPLPQRAALHRVSQRTIRDILSGRTWLHIERPSTQRVGQSSLMVQTKQARQAMLTAKRSLRRKGDAFLVGSCGGVYALCTDNRRLAVARIDQVQPVDVPEFACRLESAFIERGINCTFGTPNLVIEPDGNAVTIHGGASHELPCVEADFPDWRSMIEAARGPNPVTVSRAAMKSAIKQARVPCMGRIHTVELRFQRGELVLRCKSPDYGESEIHCRVPWSGPPQTFYLDSRHLDDAFDAAPKGSQLEIHFNTESKTALIESGACSVVIPFATTL